MRILDSWLVPVLSFLGFRQSVHIDLPELQTILSATCNETRDVTTVISKYKTVMEFVIGERITDFKILEIVTVMDCHLIVHKYTHLRDRIDPKSFSKSKYSLWKLSYLDLARTRARSK